MTFEEDSRLVHDHLELMHRLNTALVDTLLQVAKETDTPPSELAQLIGMGGGNLHSPFHPLIMRHHEERQQRFIQAQQSAQPPAKPAD